MSSKKSKKLCDIRIRDPFVYADQESQKYYLYGTTDQNPWEGRGSGFQYYISTDLNLWEGPFQAFKAPEDFWGKENFWAPEVWAYQNFYIMLATFYNPGMHRGVQILRTDSLSAPFYPVGNRAVTPEQWECLDGTLYMDHEKKPWLVFSHEWTQIRDGAVCCGRLAENLECLCEEPTVLFHASEAPWTVPIKTDSGIENIYVTDGPFLFHDPSGELNMIWSSFGRDGYAVGCSRSITGKVIGPWIHDPEPIYKENGGHAMLFDSFEGIRYMVLHSPNKSPFERAFLIKFFQK